MKVLGVVVRDEKVATLQTCGLSSPFQQPSIGQLFEDIVDVPRVDLAIDRLAEGQVT